MKVQDKSTAPRTAERHGKAGALEQTKVEAPATDAEASRAKRAEAPAAEPGLAPWLLALQHPVETPAAAAGAKAVPETALAEPSEGLSSAEAGNTTLVSTQAADDTKARLDHAAATPQNSAAWAAATSADSAAAQRITEHGHDELRNARPISTDATPGTAALGAAAFNPLAGSTRDSAALLTVNLPTPLASAEFAQALGVQMKVLVADGVQHAELQLNPAEMGPVSVQIVMDGTRAQVDFGADMAATRQAIEAGMPALASALRDAGFTLAGGGVSQHSRGRSDNSDERGQAVNGTRGARRLADDAQRDAEATARTTTRRTVRLGGLDLYA